jgi:hypothetical protein
MDEMKNGQKIVSTGKTTCACGAGCTCGCGCGCGHGHRLIWWIVGIVILAFVFALGVKAGEFRDELHAAFGGSYYHEHSMMQSDGGYGGGYMPSGETTGGATSTPGGPMIPAQQ